MVSPAIMKPKLDQVLEGCFIQPSDCSQKLPPTPWGGPSQANQIAMKKRVNELMATNKGMINRSLLVAGFMVLIFWWLGLGLWARVFYL